MNIRSRLLLLVFAVWLPAVAGFGLLARATYLREAEAARQRVQQVGRSLNLVVERELDKRAVMAKTLAAIDAVRDSDIPGFLATATAATRGTDSWAVLVDRQEQLANTLYPAHSGPRLQRAPGAPLLTGEPDVFFTVRNTPGKEPVLALLAPEAGVVPPRYNVGVSFRPAVIQAIVDQQPYPQGSLATVLDRQHRIMARSRDPARWLGVAASAYMQQRLSASLEGFGESTTLDGVPSLTYVSPPSRYHWTVVIAMPRTALMQAAQRATLQAVAAAGALLLIGLGVALRASRRISGPVLALRDAAAELGREAVPPQLRTGVSEADEVGAALHDAGLRLRQATHTLEQRVADAVQATEQAQAGLLEARKREAIGRLTGGLAHDFNNLLQTISTALQVLDRSVAPDVQRRALQAATRATGKAADLVRQMLTFGREPALQPQPLDLNDFLLKSQELTRKALGERVSLSAAIQPRLPAVFVDPTQFELALLNLLFNARDAMPAGGTIRLEGRLAAAEETASIGSGAFVCLDVVDTGAGMDPHTLSHALEPYFTTKPVGAGSGLGLAQVGAFAHQSGGEIRLDSAPGRGTRVSLLLPATDRKVIPQADEPAADPLQPALKVLMVEDDVLVSSVVVPALESAGHRVTLRGTADEALALLFQGHPCDVLFTDVVMPGRMTGMDLVAWCQANRPSLAVVVATGYTTQKAEAQVEVLRKPYALDALLAALQRALAQHGLARAGGR